MNKVILIGNLGEDPKFHPSDSGGILRLKTRSYEAEGEKRHRGHCDEHRARWR